uniref:Uncharacterized protein n=1 Tax=Cucumis melo TaxID=3656 RepID=A0A9I9E7B8_CUCME
MKGFVMTLEMKMGPKVAENDEQSQMWILVQGPKARKIWPQEDVSRIPMDDQTLKNYSMHLVIFDGVENGIDGLIRAFKILVDYLMTSTYIGEFTLVHWRSVTL